MWYVLNWKKVLGDSNEGNTAEQSERQKKKTGNKEAGGAAGMINAKRTTGAKAGNRTK